MFQSAASSGKKELVLRKDAVAKEAASAIEDGSDSSLFDVLSLNNLVLSGFQGLPNLSRVGSLSSLLQLSLTDDQLESLPGEIDGLAKLRLLDVSQNKLASLPASLFGLPSLHTLLLGHNSLTDASFPAELPKPVLPSLHQLDIAGNQLTSLPLFLSHTPHLAELRASHNSLSSLNPSLIRGLAGLRVLEAHNNQLLSLPHELASCSRLKSMRLEANPLKDRRLLKLVVQHGTHKPRAVLDYLASRAPPPPTTSKEEGGGGKKKKGKGKRRVVEAAVVESEDNDVEFSDRPPVVTVVRPGPGGRGGVEVTASSDARRLRPYLVCAVVCGADLGQSTSLRGFISLQTSLHDTVCKRRRSATIATHDLAKLTPPITYLAATATDITMTPLGWSRKVKVQEFVSHIEVNKPERSGGKKARGVDTAAASLFKYLQYVSVEEMVYLRDGSGTVISLPPLTNSENTKVSENTTEVFVEVTSSESLAVAKTVMDALVTGVGVMSGEGGRGRGGGVTVEQVRVVDEAGQLLVLYPSRTDLLTSTDISVTRPD